GDNRLREHHRRQRGGGGRVGQRVTHLDVLEANNGDDVAGLSRLDHAAVVGMHHNQATETHRLASERGKVGVSLVKLTRVNTGKGQTAEAVVHDLEGERAQGTIRIYDGKFTRFVTFEIDLRLGINLCGIGQVVHDSVQHQLNGLVLERGTAERREERHLDSALADTLLDGFDVRLVAFQVS